MYTPCVAKEFPKQLMDTIYVSISDATVVLMNGLLLCRFFSARKHGLVDAAVREHEHEKTAFIALPGGIGTLDEIFEILTLIQLGRLGSRYPVPFLLINYDGFYTKLLEFLTTCKAWGSVAEGEVEKLWTICDDNDEALEFLSAFYGIRNPHLKNTV
jgi:predicted Rossmann-fold nucleotide-binding protein